jgi:hypothetical protein
MNLDLVETMMMIIRTKNTMTMKRRMTLTLIKSIILCLWMLKKTLCAIGSIHLKWHTACHFFDWMMAKRWLFLTSHQSWAWDQFHSVCIHHTRYVKAALLHSLYKSQMSDDSMCNWVYAPQMGHSMSLCWLNDGTKKMAGSPAERL